MKKSRNDERLATVHTHTHTHTHTSTFREIKKVANEATLYCVENILYEKKIVLSVHPVFCMQKIFKNKRERR